MKETATSNLLKSRAILERQDAIPQKYIPEAAQAGRKKSLGGAVSLNPVLAQEPGRCAFIVQRLFNLRSERCAIPAPSAYSQELPTTGGYSRDRAAQHQFAQFMLRHHRVAGGISP
jgi:hypothetical protein